MSTATIIGRFEGNASFKTAQGTINLTSITEQSATAVSANPFLPGREFEGHYAILKGVLKGTTLYQTEIDEIVPAKASEVITMLIRKNVISLDRLRKEIKSADETVVGEPPIEIESSPDAKIALPTTGPRPLCALLVGHRKSMKGTRATAPPKTWEYDYNDKMALMVAGRVVNAETVIVHRDDTPDGYRKLPAKVNALHPKFIVSLHCNAVDSPKPGGTEMLFHHKSTNGKKLATLLQNEVLAALNLTNRKTKPKSGGRGFHLLKGTNAPAVIVEPFFMSNPTDWKTGNTKMSKLADAYAKAIDEYAADLSTGSKSKTVNKPVAPRTSDSKKTIRLKHSGLTKNQFFKQNKKDLLAILASVNLRLTEQYGGDTNPLTEGQALAIMNAEMGLTGRKVNVNYRHCEGERGPLPLPENVRYWNGKGAPAWNRPMPIVRNIEEFMLYLGQLKNKKVTKSGGRWLYRDLFNHSGIKGNDKKEMQLLAGVVHGYFYGGTYRSRRVPIDNILKNIAARKKISTVMAGTDYVHAGKSFMEGRVKNLAAGYALA